VTDIDDLLEFLAHRDIYPEPADSPWPTYTPDMGQLFPVDYPWLFPSSGERSWSPQELTQALDEVMAHPDTQRDATLRVPDEGEAADGRIAQWDVCAWYQQIHFYGRDWGIHIRQDCLIRQAGEIYREAGSGGWRIALQALLASLAIYFLHEHFHHKAESLAIRLQVVQPAVRRYPDYWYDVYNRTLGTDDNLEEALANADSWRRLNEPRHARTLNGEIRKAARRYLDRRFRNDPPGYRRGPDYFSDGAFRQGLYMLSSQIDEATISPSRAAVGRQRDWYWAPHMSRSLFSWSSRIHIIVPPGSQPALPRGPLVHVP
jgi:hypothetical protein